MIHFMGPQGFIQDFLVGQKKFVGHCHSVMHEYETIQIFKFSGGDSRPPLCMKPWSMIIEVHSCLSHLFRWLFSGCVTRGSVRGGYI